MYQAPPEKEVSLLPPLTDGATEAQKDVLIYAQRLRGMMVDSVALGAAPLRFSGCV